MKHLHPSDAHIILQMSLTHWVKFLLKIYGQILHPCVINKFDGTKAIQNKPTFLNNSKDNVRPPQIRKWHSSHTFFILQFVLSLPHSNFSSTLSMGHSNLVLTTPQITWLGRHTPVHCTIHCNKAYYDSIFKWLIHKYWGMNFHKKSTC